MIEFFFDYINVFLITYRTIDVVYINKMANKFKYEIKSFEHKIKRKNCLF